MKRISEIEAADYPSDRADDEYPFVRRTYWSGI